MMSPCRVVDASRLRLLLADDLSEWEKRPLESHLESCAECRAALEALAGPPGWWEEARRFVPPELAPPPSGHPTTDHRPGVANANPAGRNGDTDEDAAAEAFRPATRAAGDLWLDFLAPSEDPQALGRLGSYEVVDVLGRGGMGVVLKAFDPALDRMVALKVLSPALAASGAARHRFAREARAAAAVVHEHVVAIHAVSSWRGLPYLVMQYVAGRSLQERIDHEGPLAVEEILRIGMQAAAGLAAAHAHGLVHRDVKPSNILLENGVERVKLTDFGLARAADDASLTQSGILAGTPQYMAPEQAQGEGMDHRADLFSLGSVLYAMCAGRPPFRAETTMAVIRRVCEQRPRPLRDINPEIPAWLAAIITKLHAKDPAQRFQSATEVAELLGTHLAGLRQGDSGPGLKASAPRPVRSYFWPIAAGILVVMAGLGVAEAGGRGVVSALVGTVLRIITAEGTLSIQVDDPEVKVRVDGEEVVITGTGPQEFRYRPGPHQVVATRGGVPVVEKVVTIHRGDKEIVSISREGTIATGRPVPEAEVGDLPRRNPPVSAPVPARIPGVVWTRTPSEGTETQQLQERIRRLEEQLAQLKAGRAAASASRMPGVSGTAIPPGLAPPGATTPAPGRALPMLPPGGRPHGPGPAASAAAPPGSLALPPAPVAPMIPGNAAPQPGQPNVLAPAGLHAPANAAPCPEPAAPAGAGVSPAATPAPRQPALVTAPAAGAVAELPAVPPGAGGPVLETAPPAATVRPLVAAPAQVGDIRRILTPLPLTDESPASEWSHGVLFSAAFAPEGQELALGARDGSIVVCSLRPRGIRALIQAHPVRVWSVAFSPDGKTLASAAGEWFDNGSTGEVKLWEPATGRERAVLHTDGPTAFTVAFAPDGKTLAAGGRDQEVRLWDVHSGRLIRVMRGHQEPVRSVTFHPDGRTVVSASYDATIRFWDVADGSENRPAITLDSGAANCVAIARDGRTLAANSSAEADQQAPPPADGESVSQPGVNPGEIRLWDWASGKQTRVLRGCRYRILNLALSPDGRLLASGGGLPGTAGEVKLWDIATGKLLADLKGHQTWVECVAFSPDGKTLVSVGGWGDGPGEIKLWDLRARPPRESVQRR
jgi:hypothetical protein